VAVTACYAPDVRDCTVSCSSVSDCAAGQVCGADSFCAAPEVAGSCAQRTADAGVDGPPDDTPRPDASLPPDAAPDAPPSSMVQLHIRIDGRGSVSSLATGACEAGSGGTDCIYDVLQDVPISLHAVAKNNWYFDRWTSSTCGNQPALCTFTPREATFVRARFAWDGDDVTARSRADRDD